MKSSPGLELRVASPCPKVWATMPGTERVRYCDMCQLNVYNLSAMPRAEVERLVEQTEGRLCVTYYQRADGTILTRDCPVGMRLARLAATRIVGLAATVCLFLLGILGFVAQRVGIGPSALLRSIEPFRTIAAKLASPLPKAIVRGEVARPKRLLGSALIPPSGSRRVS